MPPCWGNGSQPTCLLSPCWTRCHRPACWRRMLFLIVTSHLNKMHGNGRGSAPPRCTLHHPIPPYLSPPHPAAPYFYTPNSISPHPTRTRKWCWQRRSSRRSGSSSTESALPGATQVCRKRWPTSASWKTTTGRTRRRAVTPSSVACSTARGCGSTGTGPRPSPSRGPQPTGSLLWPAAPTSLPRMTRTWRSRRPQVPSTRRVPAAPPGPARQWRLPQRAPVAPAARPRNATRCCQPPFLRSAAWCLATRSPCQPSLPEATSLATHGAPLPPTAPSPLPPPSHLPAQPFS